MDRDENLTDERILGRYLGPAQRETLLQFQKEDEIPDAHVRTMAQITGRGYRPPTQVEIWRNYYEVWDTIGFFAPAELYVWKDETDHYVAESWQEATELWVKRLGEKREDYYEGQKYDGWSRMGGDEKFAIFWYEDDWPPSLKELPEEIIKNGEHDESAGIWLVDLTAKKWTEVNGKGFLASSEY